MNTNRILFAIFLLAFEQISFCQENKAIHDELARRYSATIQYSDPVYYVYKTTDGVKTGVCDAQGKEIIPPTKYSSVYCWSRNGIIIGYKVGLNFRYGFCDSNGSEIIPPDKYTSIAPMIYESKLYGFWINEGEKNGFCDADGNVMVDCNLGYRVHQFCWLKEPGDLTRFIVTKDNRFYFLDEKGIPVTNESYDSLLCPYDEEPILVARQNGKWGYLNYKDATILIPYQYDDASRFRNGVAKVVKDGETMLISSPLAQVATASKKTGRAVSTYPAADSEVDKNIPSGKKTDANTYAFIIANENYPAAKVPYALNDGWTFEKYCKQTLGIKDENVHLYEDATGGNIMACVEQLKQAAQASDGNATIIFYYAGHAFPDEASKSGYLLPIDGDSKNTATGYSLEKLYKELNSISAKQIVCFIDACFSGTTREDNMLIAGRGVAIKVNDEIPQGNTVVMTSATGAETAHSYEEMHHGLFTYYLLEKLQQTKGNVTLGELSEYVTKMVKRKSVLINQKKQTPTVIPSPKLQTSWQNLKL